MRLRILPPSSTPNLGPYHLRRRVVPDDPLDLALVCCAVLPVQVVRIGLGRRVWIWVIQQVLHAKQDLLDGDGRLPALLLVQDGQADCAGGVDVRVEERRDEFAWRTVSFLSARAPAEEDGA